MTNEILRQQINDYAMDMEIEVKILDGEAYDGSIIGITEDGRMVYDFAKMVEEYMADHGCPEEEALEWLEYNTLRAIGYMGEGAPIIIMETPESLAEKY